MDLSKLIQEFIETLPMERRLLPELYADDLAKSIEGKFTEEHRTLDDGYAGYTTSDRTGRAVFKPATRQTRLVGPWKDSNG